MVLAELIGVACAIVVGVLVLRNSAVYEIFQAGRVSESEHDRIAMRRQETAEVYFKLNYIFELKLKSRSSAQIVQVGVLILLMAIAFLIITIGLKNLGIG